MARKPLMDRAMYESFRRSMERAQPAPLDDLAIEGIPWTASFGVQALDGGVALTIVLNGGKVLAMKLNPVVAQTLMLNIHDAGQAAGWLRDGGLVEVPGRTLDS